MAEHPRNPRRQPVLPVLPKSPKTTRFETQLRREGKGKQGKGVAEKERNKEKHREITKTKEKQREAKRNTEKQREMTKNKEKKRETTKHREKHREDRTTAQAMAARKMAATKYMFVCDMSSSDLAGAMGR